MPKDYANKNRVIQGRKRGQESRFVPLLAATFAVICFLGAIIYSVHIYHQTSVYSQSITSWFGHVQTLFSRKNKALVKKPNQQVSAKNDEIQFDFYTELPKMQVNSPASAELKSIPVAPPKLIDKPKQANVSKLPNTKPVNTDPLVTQIDDSIKAVMARQVAARQVANANNTTANKKIPPEFILQLGEFNEQTNASQLRLSLLLAGIETEIIKVPDHKYRVQQGPYASERQAKSAQRQLGRKGFESTVKPI